MSVSSIETSSDDRVRHESLGEDAERPARTTRFASSTLTPDQFVNIDWMPSERDSEITWKHKLGGWADSLSRRAWILIISGIMLFLLLLSVLIVVLLIFVLPKKDDGSAENITLDTTTVLPTKVPYAPVTYGNVVGIQSIYYEANNCTDHLLPANNAYQFKNMYILTCLNNVLVVPANTTIPSFSFSLELVKDNNCDCQVLSVVDRCLASHFAGCSINDVTYQCKTCDPNSSALFFSVGGYTYTKTSTPIETRTSTFSSEQRLFLSLDQRNENNNIVEIVLLNSPGSSGSSGSGPLLTRPYSAFTPATVTLNTTTSFVPDYFIYITTPYLTISQTSTFQNIFLDLPSKGDLSIATGAFGSDIFVAILATDKFYIVRQNITSGCISVLSSLNQIYLYPGVLSGSNWVNDNYILWYKDRSGVNVVTYSFKWDDNNANGCL